MGSVMPQRLAVVNYPVDISNELFSTAAIVVKRDLGRYSL